VSAILELAEFLEEVHREKGSGFTC
jgi:hypothetical protein